MLRLPKLLLEHVGDTHQPVWMEVWGLGLPVGALLAGPCWNYHVDDVHNCLNSGVN